MTHLHLTDSTQRRGAQAQGYAEQHMTPRTSPASSDKGVRQCRRRRFVHPYAASRRLCAQDACFITAQLILVAVLVCAMAGSARAQCCGDCNGDGMVTINELITAVNNALSGCGGPTPTTGLTATPSRTPTPTHKPTATRTPA